MCLTFVVTCIRDLYCECLCLTYVVVLRGRTNYGKLEAADTLGSDLYYLIGLLFDSKGSAVS